MTIITGCTVTLIFLIIGLWARDWFNELPKHQTRMDLLEWIVGMAMLFAFGLSLISGVVTFLIIIANKTLMF